MSDAKLSKAGLFSDIQSREDAHKVVKDTSMGFFVVAVIQAAFSIFVGLPLLVDALLYSVGGFCLRRYFSRIAAVTLLILALISTGTTFANMAGANLNGGSNIVLALIVLWAAIRSVEATFKLHGRFLSKENT
ncbi:MAG: hypothetical protein EG824_01205 [Deltaproteobacteria bacterium]|nr:hypothetical protein [Deltaproteobacteria bacterium]